MSMWAGPSPARAGRTSVRATWLCCRHLCAVKEENQAGDCVAFRPQEGNNLSFLSILC